MLCVPQEQSRPTQNERENNAVKSSKLLPGTLKCLKEISLPIKAPDQQPVCSAMQTKDIPQRTASTASYLR